MYRIEILQNLVAAGIKSRYGDHPSKQVLLRRLWEMKHIIDAGFVDYYLMTFWIFHHYAKSAGIGFWARGAMPSSIVCYALMLTEIDPIKYDLHSARFVNDELPRFQFEIDSSRFDEFMKEAETIIKAHSKYIDTAFVKDYLFRGLTPMYTTKKEQEIPDNLDDEMAYYALSFPDSLTRFDQYVLRKEGETWMQTGIEQLDGILAPTYGLLMYQEQMLDILRRLYHISAIEANQIRLVIQRGKTEQIATYKTEMINNSEGLTREEAEIAWNVLTGNPKAFLKAHAVSHVLQSFMFDLPSPSNTRYVQKRLLELKDQ